MGRLHFFKVPLIMTQTEMLELAEEIEEGLARLGYKNDRVLCTNFDYQGTLEEAN